jgi:hypothetical protein
VFCDIFATARVDCTRPWSHKLFVSYRPSRRLLMIGQGSDVANRFSGHSIKRGSVQFNRKIGMHDVWIMNRITMTSEARIRVTQRCLMMQRQCRCICFRMYTRLLSGRRLMAVPVSMKLSTTKTMTPRRSENLSCDLLKTLLRKSVVA